MKLENIPQAETPGDILVVDDKLENLQTIEALLKEQGYKVRCIPDAKTALEVAANKPPEIMLLDVLMPGMNGYELCRTLKARPETREFPIIFLTALTETENLVEGFQAGGVDFLSKPVRPEELLAHVKTHVELYRARKAIEDHKELLEQRVAERTAELHEANRQLRKRAKEQTCLYAVSRDIQEDLPADELLRRVVDHLVPAMQFPEITVPVIELNDKRFTSKNYTEELSHGLHAEIEAAGEVHGRLSIYYAKEKPFLIPEEQNLVDGVAKALSTGLERRRAEEELAKHREHLEEEVRKRTHELRSMVNAMAGRELRMVELKKVIKKLRAQLESAGLTPVADDPLMEMASGKR